MPGDDYLSESTGGGRGDYYQGNYGTGGNVQSMKGYQQYGGAAGYSSAQYGSSGYTAGYGAAGYNAGYGGGYQSGYSAMEAQSPLDAEIQVVIREIHTEQQLMEQGGEWGEQFKNAKRLLAAEADKLENSIDPEWLEVDIPKPIKVSKKILIPNFRHPRFNFVGKILGPKGASLQAMAKQFKCHIYVLGRGSTKDRAKEQELLASGDPQYAHYGGPLHVKVETIAPAHTAYQRIAGVLETLSQILQPTRDESYPGGGQVGGNTSDQGGDDGGEDDSSKSGGAGPMRGGRGGHGLGRGTAVRSATGSATSSTSTNRQAVGSAGRGGGFTPY